MRLVVGSQDGAITAARLRSAAVVAVLASIFAAWPAQAQESRTTAEKIRIPFPRNDGTLTPYTFDFAYPLMTLVYDTLMWRGQDGVPEPWLALRIRTSEAGRRLTIRLRNGARWHDGRRVTAQDVKFTFDYFKRRYHRRFTPQLAAVRSTEVIDAATVAINLLHATAGFNDQPLADMPILPEHLWEKVGLDQVPPGLAMGSGPYRLVGHRRGKGYRFRANRRYFLGRPRVGTIEAPFIAGFDRTVRALQSRKVDMIPGTLPKGTERELRGSGLMTETGSLYAGTALMFNLRRPPFKDVRARRAISSALDLRRIARNAVGADPLSVPADRGYLHPESDSAPAGVLHRFNEDRARGELAKLRLPQLQILAPENDPVKREAGRQVVLALTRAGQRARLEEVPAGRLAAEVGQNGSQPSFQAAIWSIPSLASYRPEYLRVLFGSDERSAPLNYSGYRSEKFDRLAVRAARETDPTARSRLVRRELGLLAQTDVPVVPLFYPKGAFVFRPQIYDGWIYVKGTGILDKRSFLPRAVSAGRRTDPAAPFGASEGGSGGIGALGIAALGLLGAVLLIVGLGVAARMRDG